MQYDMKSFGGIGDGDYDNSESFARAFSSLQPGDTLTIEEGVWKTGPLTLKEKEDITIHLEKGARILFSDDETVYEPMFSRWEGINCYCLQSCFSLEQCSGITVCGEGVLDGQGAKWWEAVAYKLLHQKGPHTPTEKHLATLNLDYEKQSSGGGGRRSQFLRPPLMQVRRSEHITIEGIKLMHSPFWTLHLLYSSHLKCKDLRIFNPKDAPNTDGIDVDSCKHVHITGCFIDVGDDGIALKSGSGKDGVATNIPTTKVRIENCTVKNAHGGAVIGSETAAGISDIEVKDCLFDGTDRGIRIKTRRGRGGAIHDLLFSHITMRNNLCPLTLNMYYCCGSEDEKDFSLEELPILPTTPSLSNITVRHCEATGSRSSAGFIVGLPEQPINALILEDCRFTLASENFAPIEESEMSQGLPEITNRGIRVRHASMVTHTLVVEGCETPLVLEEGSSVSP